MLSVDSVIVLTRKEKWARFEEGMCCEASGSCWGLCMVFRQYSGLFRSLTRKLGFLRGPRGFWGVWEFSVLEWLSLLLEALKTWKWKLIALLCLTLCDPMDGSPPGSSVHGILQARILEWVTIFFSKGSSWPRDWTQVSCIAVRFFTLWATREAVDSLERSHSFLDCMEDLLGC